MRLLDDSAEIETLYGGGFVQSIDGLSGSSGARSSDWFYFVNGIAAERGAAEFLVRPGDRMWWDLRDWTDAMDVNAVVGSYPAPLNTGYDGSLWPVAVECAREGPACELARERLAADGVEFDGPESEGSGPSEDVLRVMVGEWAQIVSDPVAARLGSGPDTSGVFARFTGGGAAVRLEGLDVTGEAAVRFGAGAGLVAAMRRGQDPPVWLVTGTDLEGVESAAAALGQDQLRNHYAVVVADGEVSPLPIAVETGVAAQ